MIKLEQELESTKFVKGLHDNIVKLLFNRVSNSKCYTTVYHNTEYGLGMGELDILAVNNYSLNIIEVKYRDTDSAMKKARKQNNRSYKYFTRLGFKVKTFIAFGSDNKKGYEIIRQH